MESFYNEQYERLSWFVLRNVEMDVLLLACLFETFKSESINSLKLGSAHYLSSPG